MRKALDPFTLLMSAAVLVATLWPAHGAGAVALAWLSSIGIAGLFFAHGAVLSRRDVVAGMTHWRLHIFIFAATFLLFPVCLYPVLWLPREVMPPDLALGFLYLAVLPSAVSSSIAFTAMARGNVSAAVCNSAASNVFGLMATPFLVAVMMRASPTGGLDVTRSLRDIVFELLLPFAAGQALHPLVSGAIPATKRYLQGYDQSVILVVVYTAFSQSITQGLWTKLSPASLFMTVGVCVSLMLAVVTIIVFASRRLGFRRADEIAAVFCGSKKSLASGLPLAQVLFGAMPNFGMIVLPIMLYNQVQVIIGAVLARCYAQVAGATAIKARHVKDHIPRANGRPHDNETVWRAPPLL